MDIIFLKREILYRYREVLPKGSLRGNPPLSAQKIEIKEVNEI